MSLSFTTNERGFGGVDYAIFITLCLASCIGGLWYSATGSKKKAVVDIRDYLLGGRTMKVFPVAMSLIASYVSGVTILGTPAEIYNYGLQYFLIVVAIIICCIVIAKVYIPVFCLLGVSSSYEYLELRYDRNVRALVSILFLMDEVLFLPMVVYVPALALNQLTGFNEYAVGAVMVVICGLYTVLGGLKAVVWTDTVQTYLMFVGVIVVVIVATVKLGGVGTIITTAQKTGRFSLSDWSFSPYERQTGWGAIIGGSIFWVCFNSVNQTMVQRYLSLATQAKTVKALAIFGTGAIFAVILCIWCGLAAFVAWEQGGCDPNGVPLINDRLLPAFVTYLERNYNLPGLAGIFLAGLFGAGLSSLSSVLNACALVGIEDIMRGWLRLELHPLLEGILARAVTGVLACVSIAMLVVIKMLGGVLGVATALSAIAASTTCGIFTLGMTCWWVGSRGAIAGGIFGALTAGTISFGVQAAAAAGYRYPPLNYSTDCKHNLTIRVNVAKELDPNKIFPLFRLSFHWIAPCGLLATLTVGMVVGWFFDHHAKLTKDVELFTPCLWRWMPKSYISGAGATRRVIAEKEERRSTRFSGKDMDLFHRKSKAAKKAEESKGWYSMLPSNPFSQQQKK